MKNKNGFTLIEITVCLIITGILACVVTPLYLNYISEAQKQNAQNNLLIINNLQHNYYFSHEGYCTGTNCNNLSNINQNLNVNITDNVYSYSCNVGSGKNPFCCNATNNQTNLDYPYGCSINAPISTPIPVPTPVNCVSDWTTCSQSCGGGTQSFEILTPASNGGTVCVIPSNSVQSCNTQVCAVPVNCVGSWSSCSTVCGTGTQTYTVTIPASNGGTVCPSVNGLTQDCSNVCGTGQMCNNNNQCVASTSKTCVPSCAGKACMTSDGCGGEC